MVSKTRTMLVGLVKEGSFKWLTKTPSSLDEDLDEMGSSSTGKSWLPELSPAANVVIRKCSKIIGISRSQLQENFNAEASESIKHKSHYARISWNTFEAHRVVSYDKPKIYDLSDDLNQIVRPKLTGPWGTRLFDKAVSYKSVSLSEPGIMEFPELKGHTRRDYLLAIIREVLHVHQYILKFQITGIERDEALLKAIFGILRVQALKDMSSKHPLCYEDLLLFNVCDQLPGGDLILETIANRSTVRALERTNSPTPRNRMYSISASALASNLGLVFGTSSHVPAETGITVGEISVGEMTPLEKAVKESRSNYKKVVQAQATVDGVKVDGLDTNLAVLQELLSPVMQLGNWILLLAYWEDSFKSMIFCSVFSYIIISQGKTVDELKVMAPPPMNAMEQLLAVQNAISQAEELIQDRNFVLLKCRALLLSIFPQFWHSYLLKYIILLTFLELFTRYLPIRKASTERWTRRLREWWFSIPAAPVVLEKAKDDKKKR
ncbi:unnamed protein product [Withania somnifera]